MHVFNFGEVFGVPGTVTRVPATTREGVALKFSVPGALKAPTDAALAAAAALENPDNFKVSAEWSAGTDERKSANKGENAKKNALVALRGAPAPKTRKSAKTPSRVNARMSAPAPSVNGSAAHV